jgi:transcriptional regulator with XRE-family HTH domain
MTTTEKANLPIADHLIRGRLVDAMKAFKTNLMQGLAVGGDEQDDIASEMSIADLKERLSSDSPITDEFLSRIGTIFSVNPDLETLSDIANALNVPPAFLLMSSSDWLLIVRAIDLARESGGCKEMADEIQSTITAWENDPASYTLPPAGGIHAERLLAPIGLRFAISRGLYDPNGDGVENNAEMRRTILMTTAMVQFCVSESMENRALRTAIGACLGAMRQPDTHC